MARRDVAASMLILRLPPRTLAGAATVDELPLSFALIVRERLQHAGTSPLGRLAQDIAAVQRVVLLLAASDVTLLQVPVPPLPAHRLRAALPGLIEDHLIGEAADCVLAAGPDQSGQRTVAVVDRSWIERWVQRLRALGARRLAALPAQLCLPLPGDVLAAVVLLHGDLAELVLRYDADQGVGLPVAPQAPERLPQTVLATLFTFAGAQPVQLAVPAGQLLAYQAALAEGPSGAVLTLAEDDWAHWIAGLRLSPLDLMSGVSGGDMPRLDWHAWRWPAVLALALLAVNIVALNADRWQLQRDSDRLHAAMTALYQNTFPNAPPADAPLVQMRSRLAAARAAAGESGPDDFLVLCAALGEALATAQSTPARVVASLDYRERRLQVRFRPGAAPALEAVRSALAARALQVRVVEAPGDAVIWEVRSAA